jgi:ABC-type Zn uptake system ZnuABC Zn-binding protein ZnuA
VAAIADADLVFTNGAGLEEFLEPLLQSAGTQAQVVAVSSGIALLPFEEEDHAEGETESEGDDEEEHLFDPHTWMDPNNVIVWVNNITTALSAFDSQNTSLYEANAEAYIQSLQDLDAWIDQQTNRLPVERRKLVSDHRTLGYFASAYGFEIVGELVASVSTNAQTSAQELARLEDQIRLFEVPAIFVDQAINPALSEQVASDTGIQLVRIYSGSLGGPDSSAASYLDMMRYNVSAIVDALSP